MTNEQALSSESVWLNIDIGSGDTLQETRLSDIRVTADEKSAGVWIYRRKTSQMLADLVEVDKRVFKSAADGGHTTESSTLELLALEERLSILEKSDIVAGHSFDQMLGCGELTKGDTEMVSVVEGVEEILVERMDILKSWEAVENESDLFTEGLLGILDLTGVKVCKLVSFVTESDIFQNVIYALLILLIWKPALIWVGRRR